MGNSSTRTTVLERCRLSPGMHVVWLKHDLRLSDHAPLAEALAGGTETLLLYIVETERMQQPDEAVLHAAWDLANARALLDQVNEMGGTMQIHVGRPTEILDQLHARFSITRLHSHEETGLQWSWDRDKRVASWCDANGVVWNEHPWNGVVRRLTDRDRWNSIRNRRMVQPLIQAPEVLQGIHAHLHRPERGVVPVLQRTGSDAPETRRKHARAWLDSFLSTRFDAYLPTISNPATSPEGSSRLSAYLTSGVLSVRQVKHAITDARQSPPSDVDIAVFRKNIDAFASRVSWRCHFVQRLEMETSMNGRSINHELDEALGRVDDEERFLAWSEGKTGWPFFDACMRSLRATGWINFRMRAMMQSVAAYTLWLPWQRSGNHLAKLFIDYEPGIHWSQIHMQSGITGINSVRAYSILKQSLDHDMNGDFIRTWVPELAMVPTPYIHEPWTMSEEMQEATGVAIGTTYPAPVVDETETRNQGIKPRTLHAEPTLSKHVRRKFTPCMAAEAGAFNGGVGGCVDNPERRRQPTDHAARLWRLTPSLPQKQQGEHQRPRACQTAKHGAKGRGLLPRFARLGRLLPHSPPVVGRCQAPMFLQSPSNLLRFLPARGRSHRDSTTRSTGSRCRRHRSSWWNGSGRYLRGTRGLVQSGRYRRRGGPYPARIRSRQCRCSRSRLP